MPVCDCITKNGTRCSRNAMKGSKFCYQHQNCKPSKMADVVKIPPKTKSPSKKKSPLQKKKSPLQKKKSPQKAKVVKSPKPSKFFKDLLTQAPPLPAAVVPPVASPAPPVLPPRPAAPIPAPAPVPVPAPVPFPAPAPVPASPVPAPVPQVLGVAVGFPNTGFPPEENNVPWDVIILFGILILILTSFVVAPRKDAI